MGPKAREGGIGEFGGGGLNIFFRGRNSHQDFNGAQRAMHKCEDTL